VRGTRRPVDRLIGEREAISFRRRSWSRQCWLKPPELRDWLSSRIAAARVSAVCLSSRSLSRAASRPSPT